MDDIEFYKNLSFFYLDSMNEKFHPKSIEWKIQAIFSTNE